MQRQDAKKPRMSLVRRARAKLRRGDYDRPTEDMLKKVASAVVADITRPPAE